MRHRIIIGLLFTVLLSGCAGWATRNETDWFTRIDASGIEDFVGKNGTAIVMAVPDASVFSPLFLQSFQEMAKRFEDRVRFGLVNNSPDTSSKPEWVGDGSLPTAILFRNGKEMDTLRGVPGKQPDRFHRELTVWILKTGLGIVENDMTFTYRFNGGNRLSMSNM